MIESKLTDYDGMDDTSGNWVMRLPHEVITHLLKDPETSAALFRLEQSSAGGGPVVALWSGDGINTRWWIQVLPLDDPGDAIEFDGNAAEAILEAIRQLT